MSKDDERANATSIEASLRAIEAENVDQAAAALEELMLAQRDQVIQERRGAKRHDRPRKKVEFRGQRIWVRVPRFKVPDGKHPDGRTRYRYESVPVYEQLKSRPLDYAPYRSVGVSTRNVKRLLDATLPGGAPRGSSSSNVQEQQADEARERLEWLNNRWLGDQNIVAVMIDGKAPKNKGLGGRDPEGNVLGKRTVLVAIGITVDGRKVALGAVEGASENHKLVIRLLDGLARRGLPRRLLWILDGGEGLWKGVREYAQNAPGEAGEELDDLDEALIQNCTVHFARKLRRPLGDDVPDRLKEWIDDARTAKNADAGLAGLRNRADDLEAQGYRHAAAWLRRSLNETLAKAREAGVSSRQVLRSPGLAKTLTNDYPDARRDDINSLTDAFHVDIKAALHRAWQENTAEDALARLRQVAADLVERGYPATAGSVRTQQDETVTVMRLGFGEEARQALRQTNNAESAMNAIELQQRNVVNWTSDEMRLLWTAWALWEAEPRWSRIADPPDLLALWRRLAPERYAAADLSTLLPPTFRTFRAVVPTENVSDAQRLAQDVSDAGRLARELLENRDAPPEIRATDLGAQADGGSVVLRQAWLGPAAVLGRFGLASDGDVSEERLAFVFQGRHALTGEQVIEAASHKVKPIEGEAKPDPVTGVAGLKWRLEASEPLAALWASVDPSRRQDIESAFLEGAHVALKRVTNNEKARWDVATAAVVRGTEASGPDFVPQLIVEGVAFGAVRGRGKPFSPVTKGALDTLRARHAADKAKEALNGALLELRRDPERIRASQSAVERSPPDHERGSRDPEGRPVGRDVSDHGKDGEHRPEEGPALGSTPPQAMRERSAGPRSAEPPARAGGSLGLGPDLLDRQRAEHIEARIKNLQSWLGRRSDEWLLATHASLGDPFSSFDRNGARATLRLERDIKITKKKLTDARKEGSVPRGLQNSLKRLRAGEQKLRKAGRHLDGWMRAHAEEAAKAVAIERDAARRGLEVDWARRAEQAAAPRREREQERAEPDRQAASEASDRAVSREGAERAQAASPSLEVEAGVGAEF